MKEVKPCPFCGEEPLVCKRPGYKMKYRPDIKEAWYITCANQKCCIKPHTKHYANRTYAISKWNIRMRPVTLEVSDGVPKMRTEGVCNK